MSIVWVQFSVLSKVRKETEQFCLFADGMRNNEIVRYLNTDVLAQNLFALFSAFSPSIMLAFPTVV